jgi:hypothetical protein
MSSTTIEGVLRAGEKLNAKQTELLVQEPFHGVMPGVYLRVEALYETDGDTFAVLKAANGMGPGEIDMPATVVAEAIGTELERKAYSTTMHD